MLKLKVLLAVAFASFSSVAYAQTETVTASLKTVSAVTVNEDLSCVIVNDGREVDCTNTLTVIVNGEGMSYAEYLEFNSQNTNNAQPLEVEIIQ